MILTEYKEPLFDYYHKVVLDFDPLKGWYGYISPTVGSLEIEVDFDESGLFEITLSPAEKSYLDLKDRAKDWINNWCDRFIFSFDGSEYSDIKELSLAMWQHEIRMASNCVQAISDVLESVGMFANEIQKELYVNG